MKSKGVIKKLAYLKSPKISIFQIRMIMEKTPCTDGKENLDRTIAKKNKDIAVGCDSESASQSSEFRMEEYQTLQDHRKRQLPLLSRSQTFDNDRHQGDNLNPDGLSLFPNSSREQIKEMINKSMISGSKPK